LHSAEKRRHRGGASLAIKELSFASMSLTRKF
jgi:hypothetical protein